MVKRKKAGTARKGAKRKNSHQRSRTTGTADSGKKKVPPSRRSRESKQTGKRRADAIMKEMKSFDYSRPFYSDAFGCYKVVASQFVHELPGKVWTAHFAAEKKSDIGCVQVLVDRESPKSIDDWTERVLPKVLAWCKKNPKGLPITYHEIGCSPVILRG